VTLDELVERIQVLWARGRCRVSRVAQAVARWGRRQPCLLLGVGPPGDAVLGDESPQGVAVGAEQLGGLDERAGAGQGLEAQPALGLGEVEVGEGDRHGLLGGHIYRRFV
jgi:hypothetical protein